MDSLEKEFSKNLCDLNRCKKIYNTISLAYLLPCIAYAAVNAFMWLLSLFLDIDNLADGIIFKAIVLAAGYYMGIYRRNSRFALLAPIFMGLNLIIYENSFNFIFEAISVTIAVITVLVNRKYAFLEKQTGFPHFNSRVELENLEKVQRGIKDPYQIEIEKRRKTESSEMSSLPDMSRENMPEKEQSQNSYMDEI